MFRRTYGSPDSLYVNWTADKKTGMWNFGKNMSLTQSSYASDYSSINTGIKYGTQYNKVQCQYIATIIFAYPGNRNVLFGFNNCLN